MAVSNKSRVNPFNVRVLTLAALLSLLTGCIGFGRAYIDTSKPSVLSSCDKYFRALRADYRIVKQNRALLVPVIVDLPISFFGDLVMLPMVIFANDELDKQCELEESAVVEIEPAEQK